MTAGLRTTLWILSSLAVLWTLGPLVGVFSMGGMMRSDGMRTGGAMMGHGGMMSGMMMGGMMAHMLLTWGVMLGLAGVFLCLMVTARHRS
ncbi:MAG: hypothetical protein H0W67_01085 [Gemmatimonadales bacterium]|nr:hypothetical protein [Gemmatimonadales bacterium]